MRGILILAVAAGLTLYVPPGSWGNRTLWGGCPASCAWRVAEKTIAAHERERSSLRAAEALDSYPMNQVDDETVDTLRSIVGDDTDDDILRALLLRTGGDVAAAANSFFDGGVATLGQVPSASAAQPLAAQVGDDVLGTLFKTLEDQGRKLAGAHAPDNP